MPAITSASWNEMTPEERLELLNGQLAHWRQLKRLLLDEQRARTAEERAALRAEIRERVAAAAPPELSV